MAEGVAEAMVEVNTNPWDAAAPFRLVVEARGRAADIKANRSIHGTMFIATNGRPHDQVLATLSTATADAR